MTAGRYRADDAVQDVAAMWTRVLARRCDGLRPRHARVACRGQHQRLAAVERRRRPGGEVARPWPPATERPSRAGSSWPSGVVDAWGTKVNKVANRVDSGSYTAGEATTDLVDFAYLAAETALLVGNEVVEAAAVLSGNQNRPRRIVSDTFHVTKAATVGRTLALVGPLTSPFAADPIPVSAVTIVPGPPPAKPTPFPHRPAVRPSSYRPPSRSSTFG